ncbi:MAG: hypothetical protein KAY59_11445 [Acidobacteria bacterium]|nr:hypothetical protein [Acidobacteriota bacterium]
MPTTRTTADRLAWLVPVAVFAVTLLWNVRTVLGETGGVFLYTDDTYIEMAIARSLSATGTWGLTPTAFSGVGTSLVWPWLLAPGEALHVGEWWPLALNVACALAALAVAARWLARSVPSATIRAVTLALAVLATPLASVVSIGMEHSLQMLVTLSLGLLVARALATSAPVSFGTLLAVGVLSALVAASRYDSLAVVVAAAMCATWARRWRLAAVLVVGGAGPVAIYALISTSHGWPLVPATVLLKHRVADSAIELLLSGPLGVLIQARYMAVLLVAATALLWWHRRSDDAIMRTTRWMLAMFVLATYAQLAFGAGGEFLQRRYDAYLHVFGIIAVGSAIGVSLPAWQRDRAWAAIVCAACVGLVCAFTCVNRTRSSGEVDAGWRRTQFLLTRQLAQLLATPGLPSMPVVQDLGEPSYVLRAPVVDFDGLGTPDVLRAVRSRTWTAVEANAVARRYGARTAALWQDDVTRSIIPADWISLGEWRVEGEAALGFYALDADAAERFRHALAAFDARLPLGVRAILYR